MDFMRKRGQVTLFMITGIILLFLVALMFSLKDWHGSDITHVKISDTTSVQTFFDNNLESATDYCVYYISLHGGYFGQDMASFYGDAPNQASFTTYQNEDVPIYMTGVDTYKYPTIADMEKRLEKCILVKFYDYAEFSIFKKQGINVTGPGVDFTSGYVETDKVSADVTIRGNDILVNLDYPLTVKKGNTKTLIRGFSHEAPFRLQMVYDAVTSPNIGLLNAVSDIWRQYTRQDQTFYLEDFDCDPLDPGKYYITIFSLDNGIQEERIIRVIDYYNVFQSMKGKGLIYQFAIKKTPPPPQFSGGICGGTIVTS